MSFKRFDTEDITISAESVVAPLWSTNAYELTTFFTSSGQVASSAGDFYYEVYNLDPSAGGVPQFAIAYGHSAGSGSVDFTPGISGSSPTAVIYGQYRTLVYGDENRNFKFNTDATVDSVYVISVDRARYKEKLLPGSFNLKLTVGGSSLFLTDSSKIDTTVSFVDAGRVYQLISGSNGVAAGPNGGYFTSGGQSYGLLLPDIGVVVFNGDALDTALTLGTVKTSNTAASNQGRLFNAIKAGQSFKLRSEETVTSNFIFVRVRNSEYNYTTNPSNISSTGELVHDVMVNNPQSYITTVGLYNDSNDLVAIAKLSRPLLKDFTKEALIRIKLDY